MSGDITVYIDDYVITVRITYYVVVPPWKGSAQTCDNDMDFYGYTDMEYDIIEISHEESGANKTGDDMDLPDEISRSELDELIHKEIKEAKDDY